MEKSLVSEVSETEKREALERVVASGAFHRSDQLKALLRYVCERELAGSGDALDEYAVAVEALGRWHGTQPDPQSEAAPGTILWDGESRGPGADRGAERKLLPGVSQAPAGDSA
jgi:hypothetical protein